MSIVIITYLLLSFSLGVIFGIKGVYFLFNRSNKKFKNEIESKFILIEKEIGKIKFVQKINQYVHFSFKKKWMIVYLKDKKEIAILENEVCIAISNQIPNSKVCKKIIDFIESKYSSTINSLVPIILKIPKSPKTNNCHQLNVDDILDKISKNGMDSLSQAEIDFLKKIK